MICRWVSSAEEKVWGGEGKGELGHAGAKRLGQGGRLPAPPGPEGIDPMEPPPRPRGQTDQGKQLDQPPVPGISRRPARACSGETRSRPPLETVSSAAVRWMVRPPRLK